jgi:hypothetical protein
MDLLSMSSLSEMFSQNTDAKYRKWFAKEAKCSLRFYFPGFIETFGAIGIGQWFHYVIGLIEFASAIVPLIPALAGIGALLLVPIMIGAVLTQLL